jgi:hypothetical protein
MTHLLAEPVCDTKEDSAAGAQTERRCGDKGVLGAVIAIEDRGVADGEPGGGHAPVLERLDVEAAGAWPTRRLPRPLRTAARRQAFEQRGKPHDDLLCGGGLRYPGSDNAAGVRNSAQAASPRRPGR